MIAPPVLAAARALATASLLILLAACGDDDDDASDDGGPQTDHTQSADQAEDGRRQGGELRLSAPLPFNLDPHSINFIGDISLSRMFYRGLYSLDKENNVVSEANGIAAGPPSFSEDGRTVTVTLNQGLKWSDGDDLRAEDFVAGIIRSCGPAIAGGLQYLLSNIAGCDDFHFADPSSGDLEALQAGVGVRALDAITIEFNLLRPQATFPAILTLWLTAPVPVHLDRFAAATAAEPGEWGLDADELAYNGPYIIQSLSEGELVLAPNPNWSGDIKPSLDSITIRDVVRPEQALDLLRDRTIHGGADVGPLFSEQPDVLVGLPEEFGRQYVKAVRSETRMLALQLSTPPLDNLDVRLALARALDREGLNAAAFEGLNQATTSWIPEGISGVPLGTYDELIGYDPDAARAHLAAAGYPDGAGFPMLTLLVNEGRPRNIEVAEFISASFRSVLNVELALEVVPPEVEDQRVLAGQFELSLGGWVTDYPDVENWILGLFNTEGNSNFTGCSDPEIDGLVSEAQLTRDEDERRRLYVEAERIALERVCGFIPFWHETAHYLAAPETVGLLENVSAADAFIPGDNVPEAWGLHAE